MEIVQVHSLAEQGKRSKLQGALVYWWDCIAPNLLACAVDYVQYCVTKAIRKPTLITKAIVFSLAPRTVTMSCMQTVQLDSLGIVSVKKLFR